VDKTINYRICNTQAGFDLAVLSDVEIEKRVKGGSLVIKPFSSECLNGAGYDLMLAEALRLESHEHRLVATLERVELADDMVGTLHIRSSLARIGIFASLALVDPGFRGQLTIALYNAGPATFSMKKGDKFLQISFHPLSTKALRPYRGRYQDSQGIVESRH
jgi:dCTP deaminase